VSAASTCWCLTTLEEKKAVTDKYTGTDNYGKPKADYLTKLQAMNDKTLAQECESKIWLSAYVANNPRSDFHWQCDACYDECVRREKASIYELAFRQAARTA
jgi:sulfur transfer protein SufE